MTKNITQLVNSGYRYCTGSNFVVCHDYYTRDHDFLSNGNPYIHHGKVSPHCNVVVRNNSEEWAYNNFSSKHPEQSKLFMRKICNNRKVEYFNIPCQYTVYCNVCINQRSARRPYCQLTIKSTKNIFL